VLEFLRQYATNRELALATWLIVVLVVAACFRPRLTWESVGEILSSLVSPKILVPLLSYAALLSAAVWAMWRFGIWTSDLTGAVVVWFAAAGVAIPFKAVTKAAKDPALFKNILRSTVGLAVAFEFFVNLVSLAYWAELVLQPVILFLGLVYAFSEREKRLEPVRNLAGVLLGLIALALLTWTIAELVRTSSPTVWRSALRELILPIWLTAFAVPPAYALAVAAGYETLVDHLASRSESKRLPLRVSLGLASLLRGNLQEIDQFSGRRGYEASRETTARGARNQVRLFRIEIREDELQRQANRKALEQGVGLDGVDADGRRLDRREFEETKSALNWLWTCHLGHYRNRERYRTDMLDRLGEFDRQGLPSPSGVAMKVRKDGQAWFAYRRTPSGWTFGVGSNGDPGIQWFIDGRNPPTGYPSSKGGWTTVMDETRSEWLSEPQI